jgi:hypothetical protein
MSLVAENSRVQKTPRAATSAAAVAVAVASTEDKKRFLCMMRCCHALSHVSTRTTLLY